MKASFNNTNQQSLQAQLAQLQGQADTNARSGYGHDKTLQDRMDALRGQMNTQAMASNTAAAGDTPEQKEAKSRQQILDYTAGRGDAVMNDAMVNAALGRLDNVSAGNDAPFTQAVQGQMLAQQAGMNASAAGDQAAQLRQQAAGVGGSLADPSYQARLRQVNAQRQSANTSARGEIATTAQLQNFGARQQATNGLMSGRLAQTGMANTQYNQASNFLQHDSSMGPHQGAVTQPFMYNFGNSGGQLQVPQTPQIQYQQYDQPQGQPQAKPMAGTQQSVGQYTNQLMNSIIPPIMRGGTPYQAPYSNSPLKSNRPQGPDQPYTF